MAKNFKFPIEQIEAIANKEGLNLYEEKDAKRLLSLLESEIHEKISNPIFVYGKRLENIFLKW